MDEQERRDIDLEDILREFEQTSETEEQNPGEDALQDADFVEWLMGDQEEASAPDVDLEQTRRIDVEDLEQTRRIDVADLEQTRRIDVADLEQTRRIDVAELEQIGQVSGDALSGDTIRLDVLQAEIAQTVLKMTQKDVPGEPIVEQEGWERGDTLRAEPFSDHWEPEYDQPMGEYVPPAPIQFQPRSRLHELKKKLVAGPEKRFYELSEQGVGKLQAAIFVSIIVALISAASTIMYAMGMVQDNRMRLMVFTQFLSLLVSGLLGSFQLIEGVTDLLKRRFTLNTMLVFTFLVCFLDGVVCLSQVRVPCCAAFSLEMTMSLWSTYQRRSTEMSRMDTMRKANRLDGLAVQPEYLDGQKGFVRVDGQVEDFMDNNGQMGKPEKVLNIYSLVAVFVAFGIGVTACMLNLAGGVFAAMGTGVQVTAVSLLAALPATAFISQTRPAWVLEGRMHRLGTVLCGWQGIVGAAGKAVFPVTYPDLFPSDAMRLNGMKFFGALEPDQVVAYAAAVLVTDKSGLSDMFTYLLENRNGRYYNATQITHYDNGGMAGVVEGQTVLIGSASFMKDMEVEVPENAKVSYGVYVAVDGELGGLFAVSYEKTQSAMAGLSTLTAYRGLQSVMTSDDFMVTHGFMRSKFSVKPKRFLLPEHEVRQQLRQTEAPEQPRCVVMATTLGLAPLAYGITGARMLKRTCNAGTVLHMIGGILGLSIMLLLVILSALHLLTPVNMFLYQLVWILPALLITEWTRSI